VLGDEVVEDDGDVVTEAVEADVDTGGALAGVGSGNVDGDGSGGVGEDLRVGEFELEGLACGDAGLGFGVGAEGVVV
jgi:hypothetical protein